ncbi:MAG: site-2 protease family protein [Patescibacteria group bacterium]
MQIDIIFNIVIIVFSVVIHEVSHGYMANFLGDPTARLQGRLTLNPISHLDPFGSVILPLMLSLSSSPLLFGWAKPVPYNPYNLRRGGLWSEALVAGAGPASNLAIALMFALFIRIGSNMGVSESVLALSLMVVGINVMLALFNLVPIPPLDGSKILSAILPRGMAQRWEVVRVQLEQNLLFGFGAVILFVMLLGPLLGGTVRSVAYFLAGI